MKLTVVQWTKVQEGLPETPETLEAERLWDLIEHRTYGKRYQQEVAIKLSKPQQAMVQEIVDRRTEEGRFDPHRWD